MPTESPIPAIPQALIQALNRDPNPISSQEQQDETVTSSPFITEQHRNHARLNRLPSVAPQSPLSLDYDSATSQFQYDQQHPADTHQINNALASASMSDRTPPVTSTTSAPFAATLDSTPTARATADNIGLAISTTTTTAADSQISTPKQRSSVAAPVASSRLTTSASPSSSSQWLLDAQRAQLRSAQRRSSQQAHHPFKATYDSPDSMTSPEPDQDTFFDASETFNTSKSTHPSNTTDTIVEPSSSSSTRSTTEHWSRRASEQFVLDLERAARAEQFLTDQFQSQNLKDMLDDSPMITQTATLNSLDNQQDQTGSLNRSTVIRRTASMTPTSWYQQDYVETPTMHHDSSTTTNRAFQSEEEQALSAMHALAFGTESNMVKSSNTQSQTQIPSRVIVESGHANFTVAIVGPKGVGKSTVVRRGLKKPIAPPLALVRDAYGNEVKSSISQFTIGGQLRTIEVLEIDTALLGYDSTGVIWPSGVPNCEAAMLCYDSTDSQALESLSKLLQAFWTRGGEIPLIVLACKANVDPNLNAVDLNRAAAVVNVYGAGIVALDGGDRDPKRKTKESFNWLIRQIMTNRGEERRPSLAYSLSSSEGHVESSTSAESTRMSRTGTMSSTASTSSRGLLALSVVKESPVSSNTGSVTAATTEVPGKVASCDSESAPPPLVANEQDGFNLSKPGPLDMFFTKEQLIDKFLFATVTGNDEPFITIFLTVYRRFARPIDVLTKLVERFDFVAARSKTDPLLSRYAQMKLCGILSTWLRTYPGDFSSSNSSNLLRLFVEGKLANGLHWVSHYVAEIHPFLATLEHEQDSDFTWGLPDQDQIDLVNTSSDGQRMSTRTMSVPSIATNMSHPSSSGLSTLDDISVSEFGDSIDRTSRRIESDAATFSTSDSSNRNSSNVSSPSLIQRSVPPLLTDVATAIMEISDEVIATQITRLTWQTFSEMSPRDLMRHVLAPRDPRNPGVALRNANSCVSRSINFVNYLAEWVATMILIQPKSKSRTRMIEKMIQIATKLRQQENFNALLGILAGLNSQPIFRLNETKLFFNLNLNQTTTTNQFDDKQKIISKKLNSLNKLMSNVKSFAAYRMALLNSGPTLIPYLGVHLQDITAINEVKRDMRDGKVNWTKFQQMGKSAAVVLDCSKVVPQLPIDKVVERMIIGLPLLDKEQQYALSEQHQPRVGTSQKQSNTSSARKRLQNFFELS
ncbi:hypothetical protein OIO90_000810 [Microbotryomycetes sp. JL221]|nr:hypothetical protein OIO90_000810 [Microbotryomycetes sp. JL221]